MREGTYTTSFSQTFAVPENIGPFFFIFGLLVFKAVLLDSFDPFTSMARSLFEKIMRIPFNSHIIKGVRYFGWLNILTWKGLNNQRIKVEIFNYLIILIIKYAREESKPFAEAKTL